MVVSNIGVYPDLSAIYTTNASMDTAFVQTSLKEDHGTGSYEYMRRVQRRLSREMPELSTYFQAGGLVDGVINQGLPAPIDIQIKSQDMDNLMRWPGSLQRRFNPCRRERSLYPPKHQLSRHRAEHRSRTGEPDRAFGKGVVDDVITALTSDGMVAPSYWIDPRSGNNYMVTVQYANRWIDNMSMEDLKSIPLRGARPDGYGPMQQGGQAMPVAAQMVRGGHDAGYVPLGAVADIRQINTPTEVDHSQIRRVIDVYVSTRNEALQGVGADIRRLLAKTQARQEHRDRHARSSGKHE